MHTFFLEQHLKLNVCYLRIIHILHPRFHPKILGHILKNKQKNKCVCFHEIIRLIIMKIKINIDHIDTRYIDLDLDIGQH